MPVFAYEAIDLRQVAQRGTIAADSAALARQTLRARGLQIAAIQPVASQQRRGWRSGLASLRPRSAAAAVADLWRSLAVLLEAGVPLTDALTICQQQERGAFKSVLQDLHEQVRAGGPLSAALTRHPRCFDALTGVVVRVGQEAGTLPASLRELADFQSRHRALKDKLATALIYPAILVLVGVAVVTFLMTYVVPQLADVLASAGRALPLPTRVLQALSQTIRGAAPGLALLAVGVAIALGAARRTQRGRRVLEGALLAVPRLGELIRRTWIARICTMLAALLRSDVRFVEALRTIAAGLPHKLYADALERIAVSVAAGQNVAAGLNPRLFPPLVAHLLALGQTSGELPQMLDRLRDAYEAQVQVALSRLLAALEPALILVLAVVIGMIVYATLLPILETAKIVQ